MARARDDRLGWFRVDTDLPRHPKIHSLADANGWSPEEAVGRLIFFWSWVAEFRIDGNLSDGDLSAMRRQGIGVDALIASAFIERTNGNGYRARNWMDYNGYAIREAIRLRARATRQKRGEHAATGRDGTVVDTTPRTTTPRAERAAPARFVRPTLAEVEAYCRERAALGKPPVDPEAWYGHYEANGWKVGRNPMRSWKATFPSTWEKNRFGERGDPIAGDAEAKRKAAARDAAEAEFKANRRRMEREREEAKGLSLIAGLESKREAAT